MLVNGVSIVNDGGELKGTNLEGAVKGQDEGKASGVEQVHHSGIMGCEYLSSSEDVMWASKGLTASIRNGVGVPVLQ